MDKQQTLNVTGIFGVVIPKGGSDSTHSSCDNTQTTLHKCTRSSNTKPVLSDTIKHNKELKLIGDIIHDC